MAIRKLFVLFIMLFVVSGAVSYAQVTIPEKVRIGLYYGSSAMPKVDIKGEEGITVGFESGSFSTLYEHQSAEPISIRKDSYFVKSGNLVIEFRPTDSDIPDGEKFGPYHVQIGQSYTDKTVLDGEIQRIRQIGIQAYPAWQNGSWFIWYGLCLDAGSAQQEIQSVLVPALGEGTYTVIQPNKHRVQVLAGGEMKLMFESQNRFLRLKPESVSIPKLINVNGQKFRGEIEVRRYDTSDMTVINTLPLEDYLYGVVPKEIGALSPIEAVKAQAVAARTYSIRNLEKYSKWGFDMSNTVSDQAYGGYEYEHQNSNKAVDQTKAKILVYNGNPAATYYFSTSGGKTENIENVWSPDQSCPYLVSVEDTYEPTNLTYSKWSEALTGSEISERLKSKGYDVGELISIQALQYSQAGRVIKLLVKGTKGEKIFEREKCRTALGLRSQWYSISTDSDIAVLGNESTINRISIGTLRIKTANGSYTVGQQAGKIFAAGADSTKEYPISSATYRFDGKGWGHGIGMSQNGAKGMAEAGFTFEQILQWYYKGTNVV